MHVALHNLGRIPGITVQCSRNACRGAKKLCGGKSRGLALGRLGLRSALPVTSSPLLTSLNLFSVK